MKKILVLVIFASLSLFYLIESSRSLKASDAYIRNRVVKIHDIQGSSCTGVQVYAPSGKIYILTAAHCAEFMPNGDALVNDEDGTEYPSYIVDIDQEKDLMLMSKISNDAIDLAKSWYKYEKVHTLTHGKGMPTYRTNGELLDKEPAEIPMFPITDDASAKSCNKPYQKVVQGMFSQICVAIFHSVMGTARVLPGSSGGPVLDEDGRLVGIVSFTDGFFSGYVALEDIKAFLKDH